MLNTTVTCCSLTCLITQIELSTVHNKGSKLNIKKLQLNNTQVKNTTLNKLVNENVLSHNIHTFII